MPTVVATVGDSLTDEDAFECDVEADGYWPNLLGDILGRAYSVRDFAQDGIPASAYRNHWKHRGVLDSGATIVTISARTTYVCCPGARRLWLSLTGTCLLSG